VIQPAGQAGGSLGPLLIRKTCPSVAHHLRTFHGSSVGQRHLESLGQAVLVDGVDVIHQILRPYTAVALEAERPLPRALAAAAWPFSQKISLAGADPPNVGGSPIPSLRPPELLEPRKLSNVGTFRIGVTRWTGHRNTMRVLHFDCCRFPSSTVKGRRGRRLKS
jgi:hypothetical protein